MIDLWTFSLFLDDIAPSFEMVEGRLFLDRQRAGPDALQEKIATHPNLSEAQRWINLVPIDDLLNETCSSWSLDDIALERIIDIYRRSWLNIIWFKFGKIEDISVIMYKDEEIGDVYVYLDQI